MGVITLRNPQTGEIREFGKTIVGHEETKKYAPSLLQQGWVPQSTIDANELGGIGLGQYVPMGASGPNVYNVGGIDRGRLEGAKQATDIIMEGYRPFGADNPYLNQAYGTDNPYLTSAMRNIQSLEEMSKQTTPSKYAEALLDRQNLIAKSRGEEMTRGYSSDLATAYSNLAQMGGLDTGARERIAGMGTRGLMESRQRLGAEDAMARSGILAEDLGFKRNLATQIPGMYNPYAQGAESWRQQRGLAQEQYEQEREKLKRATMGNIYGGD